MFNAFKFSSFCSPLHRSLTSHCARSTGGWLHHSICLILATHEQQIGTSKNSHRSRIYFSRCRCCLYWEARGTRSTGVTSARRTLALTVNDKKRLQKKYTSARKQKVRIVVRASDLHSYLLEQSYFTTHVSDANICVLLFFSTAT